jgi:hypothetical protein
MGLFSSKLFWQSIPELGGARVRREHEIWFRCRETGPREANGLGGSIESEDGSSDVSSSSSERPGPSHTRRDAQP